MPTQVELADLYDGAVAGQNGYHLTPLITLTACCPWASDVTSSSAARFNFTNGARRWSPPSTYLDARVLPVRSVK